MSWDEALDTLGNTDEWNPPAGLGPLPDDLTPRVREILAALGDQIRALQVRRDEVGREIAALSAGSGEPSTPHYIDTTV